MKVLTLITFLSLLITCASGQINSEGVRLLHSENNGGTGNNDFQIIHNQKELNLVISKNTTQFQVAGKETENNITFPKNSKVVLYNLGVFRSGDHTVTEIVNAEVKNKTLYLKLKTSYIPGKMQIQVISKPWIVFSVPSNYDFNSIKTTNN